MARTSARPTVPVPRQRFLLPAARCGVVAWRREAESGHWLASPKGQLWMACDSGIPSSVIRLRVEDAHPDQRVLPGPPRTWSAAPSWSFARATERRFLRGWPPRSARGQPRPRPGLLGGPGSGALPDLWSAPATSRLPDLVGARPAGGPALDSGGRTPDAAASARREQRRSPARSRRGGVADRSGGRRWLVVGPLAARSRLARVLQAKCVSKPPVTQFPWKIRAVARPVGPERSRPPPAPVRPGGPAAEGGAGHIFVLPRGPPACGCRHGRSGCGGRAEDDDLSGADIASAVGSAPTRRCHATSCSLHVRGVWRGTLRSGPGPSSRLVRRGGDP